MSSKSDLVKASQDLKEAFERIQAISDEHPSLVITDPESKFLESMSAVTELFEGRIDLFRRKLVKFGDQIVEAKKKERRIKEHTKSKAKK